MASSIVTIYKKVGRKILYLSHTQTDAGTLHALIEEFDYFASIPGIRETENYWIDLVESAYKANHRVLSLKN